MDTLVVAALSFVGFIVAYHTYGRWLARKIFTLDENEPVPAEELRDDIDFVPTDRSVVFGHHFTSIAGTGPIVGPAIAVFWGWLPALLWVVFGSIFVGAVHDFGALVVSLRNRGQTVGEIAGRLINPRARVLFLLVLFFALTIVLAIFGLVIAVIFKAYPGSVIPVWISMPMAVTIGYLVHKGGKNLLIPSLLALATVYASIWMGAYYWPVVLPESWGNPIILWTAALMGYCYVASVLPVWMLLQPRDYINSHQLMLALGLLAIGLVVAGVTGQAQMSSAPMVATELPTGAPLLFPFLFITIACGACSGFHCLVSSGTSSKQIRNQKDAQSIGYGAMLLEGALAVVVILACTAGVGMGKFTAGADGIYTSSGTTGLVAWKETYNVAGTWGDFGLTQKVGAFVEGGANFLSSFGIPMGFAVGIIAVLVASFAATTLDTATRLQRYVIQELGHTIHFPQLTNKYSATACAVLLGGSVALLPGPKGAFGTGGLILWPLFGATNQLLAGLALMVTVFYLWRRSKPVLFAFLPMLMMLIMPAWAMVLNMMHWASEGNYLLLGFGVVITALEIWMIIEGVLLLPKVQGVLEDTLPPLPQKELVLAKD
jgi:carbon starvation protein